MTQYYYIVSMLVFFALSIMWSRKTWADLFIKVVLAGLGGWGLVLSLISLGFIVRGQR